MEVDKIANLIFCPFVNVARFGGNQQRCAGHVARLVNNSNDFWDDTWLNKFSVNRMEGIFVVKLTMEKEMEGIFVLKLNNGKGNREYL
jgi:hypothetical protein